MMTEKIKILLIKKGISVTELANLLGTKPQNLSNKFKRNNFSENELKEIADVLDVTFEAHFVLNTGERI